MLALCLCVVQGCMSLGLFHERADFIIYTHSVMRQPDLLIRSFKACSLIIYSKAETDASEPLRMIHGNLEQCFRTIVNMACGLPQALGRVVIN